VDPISGNGITNSPVRSAFSGGTPSDPFIRTLRLTRAGELLRPTDQYGAWMRIRQRDDDLALAVAGLVLERHDLLEAAGNGQAVDRSRFDELTGQLEARNIRLFKYADLFDGPAPPKPAQTAGKPVPISDDNLLILSADYRNYVLNSSLVGYGDAETLYLPLQEMSRTLDFSIDAQAGSGKASGWFISESRRFELDLETGTAVSDGKRFSFPQRAVIAGDHDLYVDAAELEKWFPLDLNYDFSTQSVQVSPGERLPFQARIEREQAWERMKGPVYSDNTRFPRQASEYDWLSVPVADIGVNASYSDGGDSNDGFESRYYFLSKGDLGKMTSEVYLAGDDQDGLETSRVTLGRDDPDAGLLGPLKATSVKVGDIRTAEFPIIGGGETERGAGITNERLNQPREYDTTFFEGNLPPGWDIELYRNGVLINTRTVGAEGRYTFNDVPVYYGKNDFKLVFFGPQGQERTETRRIDVGNDMLPKGKGEYDISLTQKDAVIHDPEETSPLPDEETARFNARYTYGLTGNLSVNTGISSQDVNKTRHNYLNLGAKGNLEGVYLSTDYVRDTQGGDAVELFAQTGVGDLDLNVRQQFFNDFTDDSGSDVSDPVESQTSISTFGTIRGGRILPDIPFTLNYRHIQREDSDYSVLGSRMSAGIKQVSLNNYLQWSDDSQSSQDASVIEGTLQAFTQLKDLRLRGAMEYEFDPDTEVKTAELSGLYNVTDELTSELILKNDFADDRFEGGLKFNWNNGKYILSPQMTYDSEGRFSALLSFSTSLGAPPRSNKIIASSTRMADLGMASVRVFNDKNNNQVFDGGDEPLKGVTVKADQANREAKTGEDGVALVTMLRKNKPTDITLDRDSLEDPFWEPSTPERSVVPRPGHTARMEIPVSTTSEIDGTVLTHAPDGTERPLPNVPVQLVDSRGQVVREVRSEYDGFYYFQKVFPGEYTVRIDPLGQGRFGTQAGDLAVDIGEDGSVESGMDIFLAKPASVADNSPDRTVPNTPAPAEPGSAGQVLAAQVGSTDRPGPQKTAKPMEPAKPPQRPLAHQPIPPAVPLAGLESRHHHPGAAGETDRTADDGGQTPGQEYLTANLEQPSQDGGVRPGNLKSEPDMALSGPQPDQSRSVRSTGESSGPEDMGIQRYALHLSSYRSAEKAALGIEHLMKTYKGMLKPADFTIQKVNVSKDKGTWYRVMAGSYTGREDAAALGRKIKMRAPYCKVTALKATQEPGISHGLHLTSFRTRQKALESVEELKRQYPGLLANQTFSIQDVDLGQGKGRWKRVIAGRFNDPEDARRLASQIKMKRPYCKTMKIETSGELGIHLASYRTLEKAAKGLRLLQNKHPSVSAGSEFSIRRVNLGKEKGVWFRVFLGRYADKQSAAPLQATLNRLNQYARALPMSS